MKSLNYPVSEINSVLTQKIYPTQKSIKKNDGYLEFSLSIWPKYYSIAEVDDDFNDNKDEEDEEKLVLLDEEWGRRP